MGEDLQIWSKDRRKRGAGGGCTECAQSLKGAGRFARLEAPAGYGV